MLAEFTAKYDKDEDGNPAGGQSAGTGFTINWQNGPLGQGAPNGAFVETILAVVKDRLQFYQESKFSCQHNATAITAINAALETLNDRTEIRTEAGVEGSNEVGPESDTTSGEPQEVADPDPAEETKNA